MAESLVDGILAGYGIAVPVGAIAVLIVTTAMTAGLPTGLSAGAGAATGDLVYAGVAVLAGAAVAHALEPMAGTIRLLSAAVLMGIGVAGLIGAWRRPRDEVPPRVPARPGHLALTYARFLGLTMVNPLTVVYFTSLVLGLTADDRRGTAGAVLFVVGAFLASMSWQALLAGIGAVAGHGLSPRFQVVAAVVGSLFVIGMAVRVAL